MSSTTTPGRPGKIDSTAGTFSLGLRPSQTANTSTGAVPGDVAVRRVRQLSISPFTLSQEARLVRVAGKPVLCSWLESRWVFELLKYREARLDHDRLIEAMPDLDTIAMHLLHCRKYRLSVKLESALNGVRIHYADGVCHMSLPSCGESTQRWEWTTGGDSVSTGPFEFEYQTVSASYADILSPRKGDKVVGLFGVLLVAGEGGMDRVEIMARIWPDHEPGSDSRTLNTHVTLLRCMLRSWAPGFRAVVRGQRHYIERG